MNALFIVNFDFNILTGIIAESKIMIARNSWENNAKFEWILPDFPILIISF
jgi:hypothetical protein